MGVQSTTNKKTCDWVLVFTVIILVLIGFIMVYSASYPDGYYKFGGNGFYFLKKQLIAGAVGIVAMLIAMNINYRIYKKLNKVIFLVCIVAGVSLFTAHGTEANGAQRWIDIAGNSVQPSEIIKIAGVLYMAYFLESKSAVISKFKAGFIPSILLIGLFSGLIAIQKDLSTSAVLALSLSIMFFAAGANILYFLGLGAVGTLGAIFLIAKEQYRINRVLSFLDPFKYKMTVGWQVVQSLYALGSGGLFGMGLGKSRQKFFYIPEPYNDFIFSIIGEEMGFIGCILIILLFVVVIWRGIRIAMNAPDMFGSFVAIGITSIIGIQALIHIAVVTSSMPPTGIALPFISAGGTSLFVMLASVGILLNISKYSDTYRS